MPCSATALWSRFFHFPSLQVPYCELRVIVTLFTWHSRIVHAPLPDHDHWKKWHRAMILQSSANFQNQTPLRLSTLKGSRNNHSFLFSSNKIHSAPIRFSLGSNPNNFWVSNNEANESHQHSTTFNMYIWVNMNHHDNFPPGFQVSQCEILVCSQIHQCKR